jgi:hypothetical protein
MHAVVLPVLDGQNPSCRALLSHAGPYGSARASGSGR